MELQLSRIKKISSLVLLLFSAAVFVVSSDFASGVGGTPGSALFPRFIAGCIAFFAVIQFGYSMTTDEQAIYSVESDNIISFAVPILSLIAYAVLLPVAGFLLTTTAFLTGLMYYSGVRRLQIGLPLGVVLSILLFNVFVQFLKVPLPDGPLGLDDIVSLGRIVGQIV
jgi:hypothetical protein